MITLYKLFQPDAENVWPIEQMQRRLATAYGAVFSGRGTREDAELVLVDLAQFARYVDTTPLDTPADISKALDQRRAVFLRIAEGVLKSGGSLDGLHLAVLTSPPIDEEN